jgi:glycosyltransferase involved in cell wall biosynthesis
MLRVGFNARLLHAPTLRGWNRYASNLLAGLAGLGVELVLYADRPLHADHLARLPAGGYRVAVAPAMRHVVWEQWWLPRRCAADRVDVLHSPFHFGLPWASPCPRVLTLHDAIGPDDGDDGPPGPPWGRRLRPGELAVRASCWIARTRAERIITVSAHARGDLVRRLGIPAERIAVTPEAADPHFHAPVTAGDRLRMRRRHGLDRPYLFYVGGWERRKNLPFLLRAFATAALPGVCLVLAGGGVPQRAELGALAEALGLADRVLLLGWVEEAELPALYAEALGFVCPSRHEGFGLPLCEAMAVGCPILAARATSLPEVLGDGGEIFGLDDSAELVAALRRLAHDPAHRADLARRARARSEHFSWRRTAEQTLSVYHSVLRRDQGPGTRDQ